MCHDYQPAAARCSSSSTVADAARRNIHVHDGIERRRVRRDAQGARCQTLDMPQLILPSVQVNMRAGALARAGGQRRALHQDSAERRLSRRIGISGLLEKNMEFRRLTADLSVSPQIAVSDVAAIRAAGFAQSFAIGPTGKDPTSRPSPKSRQPRARRVSWPVICQSNRARSATTT